MLKLVNIYDMKVENVKEYYSAFEDKWRDLYNYTIYHIGLSDKDYYDYLEYKEYKKNLDYSYGNYLYYLIDEKNPDYIIGFGSIENSKILDYHEEYLNIGNIGYGIRPNERNKGYATILLKLLLEECEKMGMSDVCVSCGVDNVASRRVIEKNGGIFDKRFYDDFEGAGLKYWIKTKPKLTNKIKRLKKTL